MYSSKEQGQMEFLMGMIKDRLEKLMAAGVSLPANFPGLMRADAQKLALRYSAERVAEKVGKIAEDLAKSLQDAAK